MDTPTEDNSKMAAGIFKEICEFSSLKYNLDTEHHDVEVICDIPKQHGLNFEISLSLQNLDELHIYTDGFWLEWFPCTDNGIVNSYKEAVKGLINSNARIIKYSLQTGSKIAHYKSILQLRKNNKWEDSGAYYLSTFSGLLAKLLPRKVKTETIQNTNNGALD
ncbi:MAG: hypothetical protein AAF195_04980 [Pseudomonadota bacterium]